MIHKEARTDMAQRAIDVTSTATKVTLAAGMTGKEYMMIANTGAASCWIGASGVTSTTGYAIRPQGAYDWGQCTPLFSFYVVGAGTATTTLGVFES